MSVCVSVVQPDGCTGFQKLLLKASRRPSHVFVKRVKGREGAREPSSRPSEEVSSSTINHQRVNGEVYANSRRPLTTDSHYIKASNPPPTDLNDDLPSSEIN